MRRVLVIGSGGAGKSTLARRLGGLLGLEVIHLDALYWQAGWVETPKEVWRERVEGLLRREGWVMDGNYSGTLGLRLAACDTVVFLDPPRAVCVWRVLRRSLAYRGTERPDMARGCPERMTAAFLRWVWDYPARTRPKVLKLLAEHAEGRTIVRLRTRAEAEEFLARVAARRPAGRVPA
ncbi:MAG TPA: DNA topology modulation protein [Pyrinomonadaceae bacterium]|nr:DNA topology modulation protein [Pyrinomonadaceae bacterium]